jgi:hypothetical protein
LAHFPQLYRQRLSSPIPGQKRVCRPLFRRESLPRGFMNGQRAGAEGDQRRQCPNREAFLWCSGVCQKLQFLEQEGVPLPLRDFLLVACCSRESRKGNCIRLQRDRAEGWEVDVNVGLWNASRIVSTPCGMRVFAIWRRVCVVVESGEK